MHKSSSLGVYGLKLVTGDAQPGWCQGLYQAKAAELILYGRALGLGHAEAEDIIQETFLALLQRDAPPAEPERYCVRAFRNRALNYRRSVWRRLTRELESRQWFDRPAPDDADGRVAMRGLARLPVEQREVIVLKIWHEYTFEEIGELLQVSPNTAAARYRYGLQKLKKNLKGQNYERDEPLGETVAWVGAPPPLGET